MSNILTGIRSNAELHLGNYLGAMLPMAQLQQSLKYDDRLFMFVPDLHSFTTPVDHGELYQKSIDNVRMFMAAGVNGTDENSIIYRQSQIPAHSEMQWILSCFTYFGEASRMTQFKDKSEKLGGKEVSVGLFNYPILMAGDILMYDADYVPVGADQKQHFELTRTLAKRMNDKFKDLFVVPKPWKEQLEFSSRTNNVKIMSLSKPENKMSKSVDDPKGTILLSDSPEVARKKVMSATTDNDASVDYNPEKQPGISNLVQIAALLSGVRIEEVTERWKGSSEYGKLKLFVADIVCEFLSDFESKLSQVSVEDAERVLKRGEEQATMLANKKLSEVQRAVGLLR